MLSSLKQISSFFSAPRTKEESEIVSWAKVSPKSEKAAKNMRKTYLAACCSVCIFWSNSSYQSKWWHKRYFSKEVFQHLTFFSKLSSSHLLCRFWMYRTNPEITCHLHQDLILLLCTFHYVKCSGSTSSFRNYRESRSLSICVSIDLDTKHLGV